MALSGTAWLIIAILISTVLLWLMFYVATGWLTTKSYASNKKTALFFSALIIVIVIPIISGIIGLILNFIGNGIAFLRGLIDGNGQNYVGSLVAVIAFLLIMLILHWLAQMDWKDTTWVALIGLFLLYCLFSFFPELNMMGGL